MCQDWRLIEWMFLLLSLSLSASPRSPIQPMSARQQQLRRRPGVRCWPDSSIPCFTPGQSVLYRTSSLALTLGPLVLSAYARAPSQASPYSSCSSLGSCGETTAEAAMGRADLVHKERSRSLSSHRQPPGNCLVRFVFSGHGICIQWYLRLLVMFC